MSRGFSGGGSLIRTSRPMAKDLQVSAKQLAQKQVSLSVSVPLLLSPEQQQQQQQHLKQAMDSKQQSLQLWPAFQQVVMEELEAEGCPEVQLELEELLRPLGQWLTGRQSRLRHKVKIGNASLRRLLSGAFAGAVSRTAVAPLETIRTHLMVGSAGTSVGQVFNHIMTTEGWQGLFRGNGINVIRVTPSKAIELFAYDSVRNALLAKEGDGPARIPLPLPVSTVAGAVAGVCSTLCTYPMELLKTRFTVQKGVYDNMLDAFVKIVREEGVMELYRGLAPSVIGVIPYCGINYFAYESLKKAYRVLSKQDKVGNLATLLIGSTAGIVSSSATYPLEVARKQMQMGALRGKVYGNMLQALQGILEKQGPAGLYKGLGASCLKLVPAAGISFMCYEACKRLLDEEEDEVR